ncbi:hypothetical protein OV079_17420 [Nannocystis pusilla]|uniref:Uncharacterized protein n=1 Tax=Nannocystis pusilla TaxID=889268 RepID=A0A9X3IXB8_9BACT|nr:hypothetical protein [Nannocystis pusilla]MCY1007301.1 hypothetical protein [Nannocystis pusilla]
MQEARAEDRLAAEPSLLARRDVGVHDLERHVALEQLVVGLVDLAHPAGADLAQDGVALEVLERAVDLDRQLDHLAARHVIAEVGQGRTLRGCEFHGVGA